MVRHRLKQLGLERLEGRHMMSGAGPQQVVVMSENVYIGADRCRRWWPV